MQLPLHNSLLVSPLVSISNCRHKIPSMLIALCVGLRVAPNFLLSHWPCMYIQLCLHNILSANRPVFTSKSLSKVPSQQLALSVYPNNSSNFLLSQWLQMISNRLFTFHSQPLALYVLPTVVSKFPLS